MNVSRCILCLLLAIVCVAADAPSTGPTVYLSETFESEANKNGMQPPTNLNVVGKWIAPTNLFVSKDFRLSGSLSGEIVDLPGNAQGNLGLLQTTSKIAAPGAMVHALMHLRYHSGADIVFGITTDATSAHQKKDALLWLQFQCQSESFSTKLRAMNSSGVLVDVGGGVQLHTAKSEANPFPEGEVFDKIEFDYTVGEKTGTLTINGKVVDSHVPLSNPGGAVDGMFFTADNAVGSNVVYYIDDLLIETK